MIRIEEVLTATPIVLEKLPKNFSLAEKANGIILGLNQSSIKATGYTLDDIATELPKITEKDSEHDVLVKEVTERVAGTISSSLKIIKDFVIPSCDHIEKRIKEIGSASTLKDMIHSKLLLKFYNVPNSFFESPIFPNAPDEDYSKGILFSVTNFTNLGQWPELGYEEILDLISPATKYPELKSTLEDKNSVLKAWNSLGKIPYWLELSGTDIDVRSVETTIDKINPLIVLTLILNKLNLDDNPFPGVTGISLDNYRTCISRLKRFVSTLLSFSKDRLANRLAKGVYLETKDIKLEVCTDTQSQFLGADVLSGQVCVVYNDDVSSFIANSDIYSLSSIVTGMIYANQKRIREPNSDFISNFDFYNQLNNEYTESLKTKVIVNSRNAAARQLNLAINELANGDLWGDYLSEEGKYVNLTYRFEDLIKANGGIANQLLADNVVDDIVSDRLKVANTSVAPVLADVIGAPIAAEILRDNINNGQISAEEQRKLLGKAIARLIVRKLLAIK